MKPSRSWLPLLALLTLLLAVLATAPLPARAQQQPQQGLVDAMRGPTPIGNESKAPILYPTENKDIRRNRNYLDTVEEIWQGSANMWSERQ